MTDVKKIVTIEEFSNDENSGEIRLEGICTRSPDGSLWKLEIDNEGNASWVKQT